MLILSAITSEGFVNLSGNLYDFYLYLDKGLGLFDGKMQSDELLTDARNENALSNSFVSRISPLQFDNVQKFKYTSASVYTNTVNRPGTAVLSALPDSSSVRKLNKEIVISESDTSPPFIRA